MMSGTIKFYVQIYGQGGGVMDGYHVDAASAQVAADTEARRWAGFPQADSVSVWASDRKSGKAQAKIPQG